MLGFFLAALFAQPPAPTPSPSSLASSLAGSVTLRLDDRTLIGTLDTALPKGPAELWSYLAALREPYRPGDVDRLWDSPGPPEGSDFHWLEVRVDDRPLSLEPTAARVAVSGQRLFARFSARIPRRFGALGTIGSETLLMAAFPFIAEDRMALPVAWRVDLGPAPHARWLERVTRFVGDPSGFFLAFAQRGYRLVGELPDVARAQSAPRHSADREAPPRSAPDWGWLDAGPEQHLIETHTWIDSTLRRFGVPGQRWLVGALRREPAVCGENALVVSRELFRATPLEDILEFHRFGLARRAFACAMKHAWHVSAEDADALGHYMTQLLYREREAQLTHPRDLLRTFSFIHYVDSLIYAPQMPWSDVYFLAVDEPRRGPPQPGSFFHARPNGKLFYEKVSDRLGTVESDALFQRALALHVGPSVIAKERVPHIYSDIMRDFFSGALGAYPEYDIGFSVDGNTVHLQKTGPGALAHEPITVEVKDQRGDTFKKTAPGEGKEDEIAFTAAAVPLASVEVDPDRRLVEYHLLPGEHPRFNDTTEHRFRVRLTELALSFGSSATEIYAGTEISIRREYDLHNTVGIGASYDPSGLGVFSSYDYAFGPRITPDILGYHLGASLSLNRYTQGFAGAKTAVYDAELGAALLYDDRPSERTAMRGFAWAVFGGFGVPYARTPFGYAGAAILKIQELADAHALVGKLAIGSTFGDAPQQAQFALGGRANARGFPLGELTRHTRMTASVEYRHELIRGFRANMFDLVYLDGVEGALFADAILLGDSFPTLFRNDNLFYDVGYGIRFLFDQLGVNPGVFTIDVGIPLKRYDYSRPPVSVFFDFAQSFDVL